MNRKWLSFFSLGAAACLLLAMANCARNSHLVAISVTPPGATFQGIGSQVQFTAYGAYTHPPRTVDISSKVQWAIDSQNLAQVTSAGLVTATSICGSGNLSASMKDGDTLIIGSAFLTGSGIGTAACNEALLTVNILSGSGTVSSSPLGISCPTSCSAVFPLDTPVGLTASPSGGATQTTWGGCLAQGNSCTLTMTTNATVTVTFQ